MACHVRHLTWPQPLFSTSVLLEEKSEVTESTVLCCHHLCFLSPIRTHRVTSLFAPFVAFGGVILPCLAWRRRVMSYLTRHLWILLMAAFCMIQEDSCNFKWLGLEPISTQRKKSIPSSSFSPLPGHHPFSLQWENFTCGVIRSFNFLHSFWYRVLLMLVSICNA